MSMQGLTSKRSKSNARNRTLLIVVAAILFVGLFIQITMLARVSAQSKRASAVEREITELSANAENLELTINQHHNLESIAARARALGMELPDETQIRVVSVAQVNADETYTRSADVGFGGEKALN